MTDPTPPEGSIQGKVVTFTITPISAPNWDPIVGDVTVSFAPWIGNPSKFKSGDFTYDDALELVHAFTDAFMAKVVDGAGVETRAEADYKYFVSRVDPA